MLKRTLCLVWLAGVMPAWAAPLPPASGDLFGWELPRLTHIDTIPFPRRLTRYRSYGRVTAEIRLHRNGDRDDIEYTFVENGDLTRWAEKIFLSMEFTPALLDGSPRGSRVPVHVVFMPRHDDGPARYEVWLPTDSTSYQAAIQSHFLAINESLAPLLIRAGSYDRPVAASREGGLVTFEVYVRKDGGREEGRLIAAPDDEFTRQALAAVVELQILPARYRKQSYGAWTRLQVAFCSDWTFPTQPVDRSTQPYRGWPAPVVSPVAAAPVWAPQFVEVEAEPDSYNRGLLLRASELVLGHAIHYARIDDAGRVTEWFRARGPDVEVLATDWDYLSYGSQLPDAERPSLGTMSLSELARLAAEEMEEVLPTMRFLPGRDTEGLKIEMWTAVTPAIFR